MKKQFQHIFVVFLALLPALLHAQIGNLNSIATLSFVKDSVTVAPEKLFFNVLKIQNATTVSQMVKLEVTMPPEWKPMAAIPDMVELSPGKTKPIPLRITIPKSTIAGISYSLVCTIYSSDNVFIATDTTYITMAANRNWELEPDDPVVYFKPEEIEAPFSFSISNKGNITEVFQLVVDETEELKLPSGRKKAPNKLTLPAQHDTTLNLSVNCNKYFLITPFNNGFVSLTAKTDEKEETKKIKFIRLPSQFDNINNAKTLPLNVIGTQTRMYNTFNIPMVTTFLRGRFPMKQDHFLNYRIYTRDILNVNDFWQENDLELYYSTKTFEGGIGSSSSFLGKNLFIRNSAYAEYEQNIGEHNIVYGFGNKGLLDNGLGAALGHELYFQNFSTLNSVSYSNNDLLQAVTKGLRSNTSLTFAPGNNLSYLGHYYQTNTESEEGIDSKNYEHKIKYKGRIGKQVNLDGYNEYRDIQTDVSYVSSNAIRTSGSVLLGKKGFALSTIYAFSNRQVGVPGDEIPDLETNKDQYTVQLTLPLIKKIRVVTGAIFNELNQNTAGENLWNSNDYNVFVKASSYSSNLQFRTQFQYGLRDAVLSAYKLDRTSQILAVAGVSKKTGLNSELSMNISYSDGIITGINWNNALDEKLVASSSYRMALYKDLLSLNLSASYNHSKLRSDALAANATLEGELNNDFEFKLKSNFKTNNTGILAFSSVELSLSKGFDMGRKKANYADFEITYFKDENGNGEYDRGEPRIENIQTAIRLLQEDESFAKAGHRAKFKNTSVLSNKNGESSCLYLPCGEYEMIVLPLSDLGGYFNFSGSQQTLKLTDDKHIFFPFIQAAKIYGVIEINKSNFTQTGLIDVGNIRVTATDADGNEYSVLTDRMGNFSLYVPKNREYIVSINNIMGSAFQLKQNKIPVSLKNKSKSEINFIFEEKKRRINFSRG